jgi:hypothetical protein
MTTKKEQLKNLTREYFWQQKILEGLGVIVLLVLRNV